MKKIVALLALFVGFFTCDGQDILINSTNNGQTIQGCSGTIYDSGGNAGSYGNNQNFVVSFLSNNPSQPGLSIEMLGDIDIKPGDTLWIYDGDGTSASQLFHGGPNNQTYFNSSNMLISGDHFQTTTNNTSHKITFRFKSNSDTTGGGFKISLACGKLCQTVFSRLDTIQTTPQPDTNYIGICPWDTALIVAYGYYPMSQVPNPYYHQSDLTSTFHWNFGDGTDTSGVNLASIHHYFTPGRGYDVTLSISDTNGCLSSNSLGLRVMTSSNPLSYIAPLGDICGGTSLELNVGYSNASSILVNPVTSAQTSSQIFDSTTFIPDGTCIINGVSTSCYNTFVTFNSFNPGQTIQSPSDVMSVCINMEHSWVGDVHFELVCPPDMNGVSRSVKLMNTTGSDQHGGAFLGAADDVNDGTNKCDPASNTPGIGWTYCWSQLPNYTYHGTLDALSNGSSPIDSTNRANNSNYIVPEQPFSNLIGCPLNGTWNIKICDLWTIDNGYVFWWNLTLDPSLVPQAWTYDVGIDNVAWSGPFITPLTDTTARISPPDNTSGQYTYTFTIIDDFGCAYDSVMHLKVVETPNPNLGNDTSICNNGQIVVIDPHYGIDGTTYSWSDFTNDPTLPILYNGTYSVTVTNTNGSTLQCKGYDTIVVNYFTHPTANFTAQPTEGCSPLIVQFTDQSQPDTIAYTYNWDFGDPNAAVNSSTEKNPMHLYNNYGNFDVTLVVTTPNGCTSTATRPGLITVHPTPVAKFTPNPTNASLSDNPNITFTNETENYILSETTWSWDFGDNTNSTDMNTTHVYTTPNDFSVQLVAKNIYGCADTVYHTVVIEDELFIPNILTPDNDGQNDFLVIGNLNANRENVLKIYDRWGKKVYEKKNYNTTSLCKNILGGNTWECQEVHNREQGWNGEGCADGVYFYTFHYEGVIKTVDKNGTITIIGSK